MKNLVSAIIPGILSFSILSSFAADEKESALDVARSIIKQNSPIAYNPVDNSKEELSRAAAINSKLALNTKMQSDSRIEEEIVLSYALTLLPKITTTDDESDALRIRLGARLVELKQTKKFGQLKKPEVTISLKFEDGSWQVANGSATEDVLVYPANHRVTLSGSCNEGVHVLEHRERGITFDVIEGQKLSCWFVTGECVGSGHWSCGEKCSPAHEEAVIPDSVIGAGVWKVLYGEKKPGDKPK